MTMDTRTVTLHQENLSFPNGKVEFEFSREHIEFVVREAFSSTDLNLTLPMKFKNYGVSQVTPGVLFSNVAYIESQNGYFIISEDMMQHINITYSRWD